MTFVEQLILALLSSLLGTLAGAFIAIWGVSRQVNLNRQANLQTWYHEHYITNGIEPVHSYVLFVKYNLIEQNKTEKYLLNVPTLAFPIEALNRLFGMLNPSELPYAMFIVNSALVPNLSEDLRQEYFGFIAHFEGLLSRLHRELLKMKLEHPDQLHNIIYMREVNSTLKIINKITREAMSGPLGISEALKDSGTELSS